MTIGNRITALRKGLQLSQEELADKIGVSRQSVSKWETDSSAPDAFNLIALAEVLNTSVEYIVTGKSNASDDVDKKDDAKDVKLGASGNRRSNLSILGFILVAGGLLISIIGMFLDEIFCFIGGFVALTGTICALVKKEKTLWIMFAVLVVLIAATVLLLTV